MNQLNLLLWPTLQDLTQRITINCSPKNEAVFEEKIAVLEFEVKDKDKTGLEYGYQLNENDSSSSELFNSVFDSRSSDGDDNQTNDRFKKDNGYHAVFPPLTGNYMPPLADLSFAGLDDSVYRPIENKTSASVSQVETSITPPSNTSVEMPRVESVRPSGVIIEDWVSDDDEDIFQSNDVQTTVKTSFKKIEFTKARNEPFKSDKQAVKPRMVTQSPKRMPKESVLGKRTSHREVGPIWNNIQRINHQNKFVPTVVLTSVSKVKVNTVKVNGVNTTGQSAVCIVKGNGVTAIKALAVSQMCDKKNSVLFTKTECLVLSPDFKLIDESQVLLRVPKQNNMYIFDLKNGVPSGDLTCLFSKATIDESKLWHRRLSHVNFKIMNKLVKGSLMLDMDLFGPTSVRSINHKTYCLVVTDDFIREMDEFCGKKRIKREYSVARTPQQNRVAERKNRTLIEATRTMLADSLIPTIFWAEAVNNACYVLNRVLVTKPHNKTPYELIIGRA
ncbi:ribonuclease H-like domain-containing protein, partial [Tanacetum coccineum]